MSDNFITINTTGQISDEFAADKDKKKAYQIFFFSAIGSIFLTSILYALTLL